MYADKYMCIQKSPSPCHLRHTHIFWTNTKRPMIKLGHQVLINTCVKKKRQPQTITSTFKICIKTRRVFIFLVQTHKFLKSRAQLNHDERNINQRKLSYSIIGQQPTLYIDLALKLEQTPFYLHFFKVVSSRKGKRNKQQIRNSVYL